MDLNDKTKYIYINNKIKEIIEKYLIEEEYTIDPVTNLEALAINSIDALELLILIEQEFHIEIQDEDLNMELLSDLKYLSKYVLDRVSDDYF